MVEKLSESSETLILDTPYLRRMRESGRQEGRKEAIREAILKGILRKFQPSTAELQQLEQQLEQIHNLDALQQILLTLFDATILEAITNRVAQTADSP